MARRGHRLAPATRLFRNSMPQRQSVSPGLAAVAVFALLLNACESEPELDDHAYADEVVTFDPAEGTSFGHDRLPEIVLGPPGGFFDVASLGCGGEIVLRFDEPGIVDGPGVDLI